MNSNSNALDLLVAAESDQIRKRLAPLIAESNRIKKQLTKDSGNPKLDRFVSAVAAESDQIRKRLAPLIAESDRIKKQQTKSIPADSDLAKEQRANMAGNKCHPSEGPNLSDWTASDCQVPGTP